MAPSHVLVTWALLTATVGAEAGGGGAPPGDPPGGALTPNGASGKPRTAPYESQKAQRRRVSPYQQTVPYVIAGSERHRLDRALRDGFPISLLCTIETGGNRLVLELERNENLLPGTHRLMYYLPNGSLVTEEDRNMTNCYYHGSVHGFADSRVSVSLCSGLRGLVVLARNQSYGIEPLSGDRNGVHLIHRIEAVHFNRKRCAVSHQLPEHSVRQQDQPDLHRSKRDTQMEKKYIELVMVADNKEFRDTGYNLKTLQMRLLEIANQMDAFYRPLNVRVALVGVEVWTDKDPIEIVKSPGETLNRFLKWRELDLLPRLHHDNAQLLIGGSFTGGTVGMASQSSMCSKDRSGGVNVDHSVSVLGVASTVAHELGHNLGISHDTDDRKCTCQYPKRQGGCIMEPSTGFLPGQAFSSCSRDDLERSLHQGVAMCLFDFPAASRLFGGQRCGNLYVEEGEECDCGLLDECDDPCCNATSCKLLPGAECSSQGTCCSNCKLKRAATVCRPPLGDCDLPEYCTGVSPYCPPNVFLKNGHSCDGGRAYCYNGACLTFEGQCQVLWGPGSVQAHDICFTMVNQKGNKYGNCGRLPDGTFVSCAKEDAKCGKIQCQGGNDRPILGSNAEILVTNIKLGPQEYSCRGTFFNFGEDIADPALVMPGTVCGHHKACINRTCQDISMFHVEECLQKCNSHGVCNSNENCHCDVGWAPPHCRDTGYGGSIDSGPVQDARGQGTLLVALLVPLLLILLVGLALCYRKRDSLRAELRKLGEAGTPRRRDSRVENGTRSRTVGGLRYKPPECIQQAELRPPHPAKCSQHVPQPLLRPPPPTKPLPPGPVVNVRQPRRQTPPGRPPPPSADLPADPAPKGGSQPVPSKPPPPKKPLPSDPDSQLVSMRMLEQPEHPRVSEHMARRSGPSPRPAPPPPPGKKPPPLPPLPLAEA